MFVLVQYTWSPLGWKSAGSLYKHYNLNGHCSKGGQNLGYLTSKHIEANTSLCKWKRKKWFYFLLLNGKQYARPKNGGTQYAMPK